MDITEKALSLLSIDGQECLDASSVAEHFRTRKGPNYLFDFETAKFVNDESIIEDAEKTMNHYIYGHQFDGEIVWDFNPTAETSRDNEWTWSLYRTIFWQPLARAYAVTGDEKYIAEFAKELKQFYKAWPADKYIENPEEFKNTFPGFAWRTIETGIRIYTTWLPCFEIFRRSPAFDDETWMYFLASVHDHATFLLGHYSNHNKSSNWLSMESSALLQMGIMFPEFKDAHLWKEAGYQRVMHEIAYCFDSDGVHMERTPIYHLVASIAFLQAVEMCQKNSIPVPPYALPILEKSAEFLLRIMKPDFSNPMLGDADRDDLLTRRADRSIYEGMNLSFFPDELNEIRAYFAHMAELTGRSDFLFLATGGKEGDIGMHSTAMHEAGIFVERTGMGEDDDFVMTQMIKLERGEKSTHSHNDTGHVELMLRGEDILIDCGRYIYNTSIWKNWRHYFTSAAAHNTLYVDDHEMGTVPGVVRVRGVRGWCHEFTPDGDLRVIDISHNGYVFTSDSIFHRRQIIHKPSLHAVAVVDYVTGLGNEDHDIRLYWNYASSGCILKDGAVEYRTPKGRSYRMIASSTVSDWNVVKLEGSEDPIGGWASFGYPIREPISQIIWQRTGRVPFTIVTVISPECVASSAEAGQGRATIRLGDFIIEASEKGVREI